MKMEQKLLKNWYFSPTFTGKVPTFDASNYSKISLPHTWNALDGQDGGADYRRGTAVYLRKIVLSEVRRGYDYLLKFEAASYDAHVYLNGKEAGHHKGGYSAFYVDITAFVTEGENILAVTVSNEPSGEIYPQMADFTFYGGLHRGVSLIIAPETRFDHGAFGASGLLVSSDVKETGEATLHLRAKLKAPDEEDTLRYTLTDEEGVLRFECYRPAKETECHIPLQGVHLWNGILDPYLYTVTAEILRHNEVLDTVETKHGFRYFAISPEKGFSLNGKPYPLRGVSRHGDKLGLGNALSETDELQDAELIRELGANCVRLAHYQHSDHFYSLCDRLGLIVWAEIPFISRMLKSAEAHENAMIQLNELIAQNINHSAICFWGISNEITIGGETEGLTENLRTLHSLAKELDPSRPTVMAQVSMLPMESEQNRITDVVAYNHYFGWYGGDMEDNEKWLDAFHAKYPDRALGLSEYGCEGILTYHSNAPKMGDYSEEYQARYHEHMMEILQARPWIWGSFIWNMFDFGCDARNEGGVMGRNNKGLVTFDRRIRKDAFYLYKTYWREEPMVHICGKRHAVRSGDTMTIRVYSNLPTLVLSVNGHEIAKKDGCRVFEFADIPVQKGMLTVSVRGEGASDRAVLEIADKTPAHYTLKESAEETGVTNWFEGKKAGEMTFHEGFYSVRYPIKEVLKSDEAAKILVDAMASASGLKVKRSQLFMLSEETLEGILRQFAGGKSERTDQMLAVANEALQKIKLEK